MQNLCPDKMKLNKFVHVDLPKNKVLYLRCAGIRCPHGSHEVPVADFTSRDLESTQRAVSQVVTDYNDYLRESQMPLDTPIPNSSSSSHSSEDE